MKKRKNEKKRGSTFSLAYYGQSVSYHFVLLFETMILNYKLSLLLHSCSPLVSDDAVLVKETDKPGVSEHSED